MFTVKAFGSENACFSGAAILNNCDVSQLTYETNESSLCESNRKSNRKTSSYSRWQRTRNLKVKKLFNFFDTNTFLKKIAEQT